MDRDGVEVHKLAKKEGGQYPAILTKQAWSIKDLLQGKNNIASSLDTAGNPARVANHSAGFDSSRLVKELAI